MKDNLNLVDPNSLSKVLTCPDPPALTRRIEGLEYIAQGRMNCDNQDFGVHVGEKGSSFER